MIFFDAYAIIEIINGNENYQKFKDEVILTNTLHLSEVFYSLLRNFGEKKAGQIISNLDFEFIEISEDIVIKSAEFKFKNKNKNFSYSDCIGYISAISEGIVFLTGDKEFEGFEGVEFVK